MKKTLLSAAVFCLVAIGCKKDDNCDLSAEKLVGSYRLTGLTYKTSGSATATDVYNQIPPCERDDLYVFNSNGTTNYVDAGTLCAQQGNFTSSWSLSGNTLFFAGDSYNVVGFDC